MILPHEKVITVKSSRGVTEDHREEDVVTILKIGECIEKQVQLVQLIPLNIDSKTMSWAWSKGHAMKRMKPKKRDPDEQVTEKPGATRLRMRVMNGEEASARSGPRGPRA